MIRKRAGDLHADGGNHLSAERIGELAERAGREDLEIEDHPHLFGCHRCFATFAEFVRIQTAWSGGSEELDVPRELLEAGRRVGGPAQAVPAESGILEVPNAQRARRRAPFRTAAGLVAATLAGLLLWTFATQMGPRSDSQLIRSIQAIVCDDSAHGLVHSGCDNIGLVTERDNYRNGTSRATDSARAALDRVAAPFKTTAPPAEEAYWLAAGYLALSELDIAHTYLAEARRLYPEDRRLRLLSAHLAYKQSDLSRARTILERMVREDPDDGLAQLNLGIVLKELDDPRSRQILQDLQRRFADTPLAQRAALELSER